MAPRRGWREVRKDASFTLSGSTRLFGKTKQARSDAPEKFEIISTGVGFAVAILTPDDLAMFRRQCAHSARAQMV